MRYISMAQFTPNTSVPSLISSSPSKVIQIAPSSNVTCKHLYFLRKLRRLQVDKSILNTQSFYNCFIQSTLTFSILAWFGSLSEVNKCPLNRIIKMSGKIIGQPQTTLTAIYENQAIRKSRRIISDPTHNLNNQYHLLPSGRRLRSLPLRTKPCRPLFQHPSGC